MAHHIVSLLQPHGDPMPNLFKTKPLLVERVFGNYVWIDELQLEKKEERMGKRKGEINKKN